MYLVILCFLILTKFLGKKFKIRSRVRLKIIIKMLYKGIARNWMEINQPVKGCAELNGGKHA